MKIPEFRVTSKGVVVDRVLWDPKRDGEGIADITGMKVLQVKRVIVPGDLPRVEVTFVARLVEVDSEDASSAEHPVESTDA